MKPVEQRSPYKAIKTFSKTTHRFESEHYVVVIDTEGVTSPPAQPERKLSGHVKVYEKGAQDIPMYEGNIDGFVELTRLALFARCNAGIPDTEAAR